MFATVRHGRITPNTAAIAMLAVHEYVGDMPRVAIPRPEFSIVVRYGAMARDGVDAHVLGVRDSVHRKFIRDGQGAVTARLRLGAHASVLGVGAAELAGRIVALEDLWGDGPVQLLRERMAGAASKRHAATVLDEAVAQRGAMAPGARTRLALGAAARLGRAPVSSVADDLGVSERHLRRIFRDTLGMGPKTFTKLTRFNEALRAAREVRTPNWATIAATAGYYDQAHLIADFRAIAGVTPRTLLGELRAQEAVRSSG